MGDLYIAMFGSVEEYLIVNYSLEVFHSQIATDVYSYCLDLTLLLNTICLPIMIYVIVTQSSNMGPYKWYNDFWVVPPIPP